MNTKRGCFHIQAVLFDTSAAKDSVHRIYLCIVPQKLIPLLFPQGGCRDLETSHHISFRVTGRTTEQRGEQDGTGKKKRRRAQRKQRRETVVVAVASDTTDGEIQNDSGDSRGE